IDRDENLAAAEAAGAHRLAHLPARIRFRVGRDRVLEIEDQRIGRERPRLLDRPRVRSGHVEHAAARTHVHGTSPVDQISCGSGGVPQMLPFPPLASLAWGGEPPRPRIRRIFGLAARMNEPWLAGVDICPAGWIAAFAGPAGEELRVRVAMRFADVVSALE